MPALDGCGRSEITLILPSKPNLDGIKGFCSKFRLPNVYTISRQSSRIANPSIYLIDKGCMLHESGYNVHCKSFPVYGERPYTISHAALSTVYYKGSRLWISQHQ